jgi:hypothetical protein
MSRWIPFAAAFALTLVASIGTAPGQDRGLPQDIPPPPPPPPTEKREAAEDYEPIVENDDANAPPLPPELLQALYEKAAVYRRYVLRFECDETARTAEYDDSGQVKAERVRNYGYLLLQDDVPDPSVREYRQEFAKNGSLKPGAVEDVEPFPPAYAWVFLFSRFNEPYFTFRLLDDRFDGFDWVYEIRFRGSLPFRTGKDIREWEGTVLIDAVTHTPLEIRAEPAGQRERIEALYRQWRNSFNLLGMRTGPRPLGYRAQVQFRQRYREAELTFPTDMRYDTFTAVSVRETVPLRASIRDYSDYKIYRVQEEHKLGEPTK